MLAQVIGKMARHLQFICAGLAAAGSLRPKFPDHLSDEIEQEYEWLYHTESEGKSSKILFLPGGNVEATIPGCKNNPGACIWAANNGEIRVQTRKKKTPLAFTMEVMESVPSDKRKSVFADAKKLQVEAVKQIELVSTEVAKTGAKSRISFNKIVFDEAEAQLDATNLYDILGVDEEITTQKLKSAWRKLSYENHPDQGGDQEKFDKMRDAYEYLEDRQSREQYSVGGRLLAHNYKQLKMQEEQQNNQMLAMLDQQVPRDHPQRAMAERDVKSKMKTPMAIEADVLKALGSPPYDVSVPVALEDLVEGKETYEFAYPIRKICIGR